MGPVEKHQNGRDRDGIHSLGIANGHAGGNAAHVADLLIDDDEIGAQLGDGLKHIDACPHSVDVGRIVGQSGVDFFEDPVGIGGKKDGGHGADSTGWYRFRPTIGSGRALGGEPLGKGREALEVVDVGVEEGDLHNGACWQFIGECRKDGVLSHGHSL
ncbi:unannotated protein [freshwater metagenome]|uniref:Unannotated protein n=1 Tax=freshwater metagenome TaxID=449393 RepID=A0A6J6KPD7_9ZZZZ